jgi:hypothetical protein
MERNRKAPALIRHIQSIRLTRAPLLKLQEQVFLTFKVKHYFLVVLLWNYYFHIFEFLLR